MLRGFLSLGLRCLWRLGIAGARTKVPSNQVQAEAFVLLVASRNCDNSIDDRSPGQHRDWIDVLFLPGIWPFRKHPERLTRSVSLFKRFGGSSVFIGRFFGPLRAIIPMAAGMLQMPPLRFYAANVFSAMVWAPALVLSGDLLTQSLFSRENLATKILYITFVAAAATALVVWVRRQFLVR